MILRKPYEFCTVANRDDFFPQVVPALPPHRNLGIRMDLCYEFQTTLGIPHGRKPTQLHLLTEPEIRAVLQL